MQDSWKGEPPGFDVEPLDRGTPDGAKIPVFVSRAKSYSFHRADLWLVQGGPGGSASYFYTFVDELRAALPGVDIYTIEHRGVGQSARLGCPEQESPSSDEETIISLAEVPACVAALEEQSMGSLRYFRLTPAAQDLAEAVDRTRTPGTEVFIYGVSYGTSVAIRYMQLRPQEATGVILDSVSPPGLKFFSDYEKQYDGVLQKLAALGKVDPSGIEPVRRYAPRIGLRSPGGPGIAPPSASLRSTRRHRDRCVSKCHFGRLFVTARRVLAGTAVERAIFRSLGNAATESRRDDLPLQRIGALR